MKPSSELSVAPVKIFVCLAAALCLASCGGSPDSDDSDVPAPPEAEVAIATGNLETSERPTAISQPAAVAEKHDFWLPPASGWLASQQRIAESVFKYGDFDLLVAPVQGDQHGFDPIERSLITRLVANRIARSTEIKVANPTIVLRYLGTHRSTYPLDEVRKFAGTRYPHPVLLLRAEHNGSGKFDFEATLLSARDGAIEKSRTWSALEFSDSAPPAFAIAEILDQIVELVSDTSTSNTVTPDDFDAAGFRFPLTVEEMTGTAQASSLYAVASLQMIGMLHPSGAFNETRNHLFERSLIALLAVSPSSPYYRYFKARALAYLDRRPAAIEALGKPDNSHERALLATLNGNLPSIRAEVEKMGTSVIDLMAWKDLLDIEYQYNDVKERELLETFVDENPLWAPFLFRSLRDRIDWAPYSSMTLKLGLEAMLPNDAIKLDDFVAKAAATDDSPSELELTQLLWRHIERFEEKQLPRLASMPSNHTAPSELDILDLAKTFAIANHMRDVEEDLSSRGLPDVALKRIQEFEPLYAGHPAITMQKARALSEMVSKSEGSEKRNLHRQSVEAYLNGFAWTGQLTIDAVAVSRDYDRHLTNSPVGSPKPTEQNLLQLQRIRRVNEWPKGTSWYNAITFSETAQGALQRCIDYTWTRFACLRLVIESAIENSSSPGEERKALLHKFSDRFVGHPERDQFLVASARAESNSSEEITQLDSEIESGSVNWEIYYARGRIFKRDGDYAAAQRVWLSYPGYKSGTPLISVAESNYANDAGSMLYWIGQHELALPLLDISANSNTGSGASMSSGARIALIHGDLDTAAQWSAARVRRYGSAHAARDLIQILHILGEPELAWSVFDQIQSGEQDPHIWSGALIGHRKESASITDIQQWIEGSRSRKSADMVLENPYRRLLLAQRYLLLAGTMDRAPDDELARIIGKVSPYESVYHNPEVKPHSAVTTDTAASGFVLHASFRIDHDPNVPVPDSSLQLQPDQNVLSRYEMLAQAMVPFSRGDHKLAFRRFNQTAHLYELGEYLPYLALSATALGDAEHLANALRLREPALEKIRQKEELGSSSLGYRFNEDLTYAVLATHAGKHDEAIKWLRAAFNNQPYIQERTIYPSFQVVEVAEQLFDRTKVGTYRELALEISRRHTIVLPMYAWAYLVVATHSESENERIIAAASGLALDPQSYRASRLPESIVSRAEQLLSANGAPYLRRTDSAASDGI